MIRVNLLEGTAEQRVAIQKTKVAARRGQQLFLLGAALLIFAIAIGVDHLWTNTAFAEAKAELEREQAEAEKLKAEVARKAELENELKQLEERIKVIRQLRAEQKGPVALMSAINERMPATAAQFLLESIVQKGSHLQIKGSSLNQQFISDFARQLEFSNGLFSNVMPSIVGQEVKADDGGEKKGEEVETVRKFKFTIDCDYNKPRADGEAKQENNSATSKGK